MRATEVLRQRSVYLSSKPFSVELADGRRVRVRPVASPYHGIAAEVGGTVVLGKQEFADWVERTGALVVSR